MASVSGDSRDRFVPLQGCFNFRDLGGYPTQDGRTVRRRRLFRSDAIHHMVPADVDYVCNTLGIVTVLDLRDAEEARHNGDGAVVVPSARYYNIPFLQDARERLANMPPDPAQRLVAIYLWILQKAGRHIASALTTLAATGSLPAVFHCSAGKDRTGVLAAIVLDLLGVADQHIVRDYIVTNQRIDQIIQRLSAVPGNEHMLQRPVAYFAAQPVAIEMLLAELRREYGGAAGYLSAQSVSEDVLAGLRESLLE